MAAVAVGMSSDIGIITDGDEKPNGMLPIAKI